MQQSSAAGERARRRPLLWAVVFLFDVIVFFYLVVGASV